MPALGLEICLCKLAEFSLVSLVAEFSLGSLVAEVSLGSLVAEVSLVSLDQSYAGRSVGILCI